jgi:hypothetical protein
MFRFRKCRQEELPENRCWLTSLGDSSNAEVCLTIGRLLELFGEPDYSTDDFDNLFSYAVVATDEYGNKVYLEIYHGPSGLSIGGERTERSKRPINDLKCAVYKVRAKDFCLSCVYNDLNVKVKMGIRHGIPFYETGLNEDFF